MAEIVDWKVCGDAEHQFIGDDDKGHGCGPVMMITRSCNHEVLCGVRELQQNYQELITRTTVNVRSWLTVWLIETYEHGMSNRKESRQN